MTDDNGLEQAEAEAAAEAALAAGAAAANDTATRPGAGSANAAARPAVAGARATIPGETYDEPTSAEYSIAFSPRNLAVGLAIVAGLVAFAARRRRRRSRRTEVD